MRTEQLLREALTEVADRPLPTEGLRRRILAQTAPRAVRRRRAGLVLALVVALVAVVVPVLLNRHPPAPADTRVRGNWNMIHRVDLPAGWTVSDQVVTADSESTSLRAPSSTAEDPAGCMVEVWGPGRPDPSARAARREPVQVNGAPGFYVYPDAGQPDPSTTTSGGITWRYADSAYAEVSCGDGDESLSLDIADRVRFEAVPTRLPFRLRALPVGYEVRSVAPPNSNLEPPLLGAVMLSALDPSPSRPAVTITVQPGTTAIPPGLPGWETDTVDGTPAVLSARDGRLCLNTRGHSLCVDAGPGEPADLTTSLWPAGRRDLLVAVAKNLTLTRDLDDQEGWYTAEDALPG